MGNRLVVFGGDRMGDSSGGEGSEVSETLDDTWIGTVSETGINWFQLQSPVIEASTGSSSSSSGPCARYGYSAEMIDESILLFGGVSEQNKFLGDTHILSLWGL